MRHVPPGSSAVHQTVLQAESAEELRRSLTCEGSIVLALSPATSFAVSSGSQTFDVGWWCRELETLLRAGMTAVEAIDTLAAGRHDEERSRVHDSLLRSLREGASLSRAMHAAGAFPEVLVAGVTASERTSKLADALRDYLRYDELIQRLRRQAVSAALYPAMVISLGAIISIFLLLYVIPRFSRMYGDTNRTLSWATEAVLWLSRGLRDGWPLVLGGLIALCLTMAWAWRTGRVASAGGWLVEEIAPLRRQWDHYRLAKLYQSLAMLFRGGYTLDEALKVCLGLKLGRRLDVGTREAREQIGRGKSASAAMTAAGLTEATTERLLAVGERTGAFAEILQTIADRHAQLFATFVERATRVVEPVLLLSVALVVGSLVVMMYMPIFDIAGGLGISR